MNNDYECPKCHNIFPSQNRIMHDARCTEENPMPLDQSRQILLNNQNNPIKEEKNEYKDIKNNQEKQPEKTISPKENSQSKPKPQPQPQPEIQSQQQPLKKSSASGEFPNIFVCDICGETLAESEKKDHMLCHNLQREENELLNNQNNLEVSQGQIEQQRQIERIIQQQNDLRRQMQNQQNQRTNQQNTRQRENYINPNRNQNNLFDRDTNMLSESDMQFLGGMGGRNNNFVISQTTTSNPNSGNRVRIISTMTGPNGQIITRQYGGDDSGEIENMMNNMNLNIDPFNMMFGSSGNRRGQRMNIPFSSINSFGMNSFIQQFLQNMGRHEHPTDQQILDELPETRIDDVTKLDPEKRNCVICLEDFKN